MNTSFEQLRQQLHPCFTTWHITFGAHGARLHGGERPTVDRQHNQRGEAFIYRDEDREDAEVRRMNSPAVSLTAEQCMFIEATIPSICERGGWVLRTCAAPPARSRHEDVPARAHEDVPARAHEDVKTLRHEDVAARSARNRDTVDGDHVHVLLDAPPEAEPKVIRELLKRWLTQAMNERFPEVACDVDVEAAGDEVSADSRDSEPARPRAVKARGRRSKQWWAEGGSTKPVKAVDYLNNAYGYIKRQRATGSSASTRRNSL